ncbi:PASTA domain-containing protein [Nonomuraea sp. NPDC050383]|uniref:PASTA domain-containing protein n=1 Tax=Nonomuraea sp. NPDC050383 TaxID=3364362 RepID=UPI003792A187
MRVHNKILGGALAAALATALTMAGAGAADAAATPLVFDLNGTFTDGGSARPVISDVNDILTVDMSSQHRPTATGVVINSDTILVTFPDDAAYTAKLQAPNTIRWSNGSTWQKLNVVRVPNVLDETKDAATSILNSAGLVVGRVNKVVDKTCNHNNTVSDQTPAAGTLTPPGSLVDLTIGVLPQKTQCP